MRKVIISLLWIVWIGLPSQAQETISLDSLESEVGLIPESLDANIDSLFHSWHVQYFSKKEEFCHDDEENVFFPDSVFAEAHHLTLLKYSTRLYRFVCRPEALPGAVHVGYGRLLFPDHRADSG